jgi:hypothetical protein
MPKLETFAAQTVIRLETYTQGMLMFHGTNIPSTSIAIAADTIGKLHHEQLGDS